MSHTDHKKIINKVAKKILSSHGITQKGQSRIWLDDNGWFVTVIEFQPFHGRQGTTLNIGVNFNWYEEEYFSFDIGYRQDIDFVDYDGNEDMFSEEIEKLCHLALNKILEFREKFKNLDNAKLSILNNTFTSEEIWGSYHKGTICGLTNEYAKKNEYYQKILDNNETYEWLSELKSRVNLLENNISNHNDFSKKVIEIIKKTRTLKKLKEKEIILS
ncbi:hypothetical protein H1R17_09965 [Flavobacterium sp. xlx-214]|uniref:hypothetical protein n=1 Tax=unclassified Flavobacterium TaxID=196869 RepID=UPI0013D41F18|nr:MULTISPECIES: hypothetical protein [unclassified Flavobacterium]MBA5793436.1 hypothetical protein [Flavobacterium sp. xlx-221]QMI82792.1 hypothetical protein H1R17_09965 [Flavobacterium sp. xlx-214]